MDRNGPRALARTHRPRTLASPRRRARDGRRLGGAHRATRCLRAQRVRRRGAVRLGCARVPPRDVARSRRAAEARILSALTAGELMTRRIVTARLTLALGAALGITSGGRTALAHHSFAPHFDASKPVSISGTITEFEARNPHSYLHISAVDENGRTREYVCESHGVTQLSRTGLTPATLKAG